jgi:hypothetical protein
MKMESLMPTYRLLHFIGLALLLGGSFCSVILVQKEKPSVGSAKLAWNCMHLAAAPGLMILLITGLLQSSALYWKNFKGAGYMHAKVLLAFAILLLIFFDMRGQKAVIRLNPGPDILVDMVKKRQLFGVSICLLTLLIMWLVSFRPF